MLTPVRSDIIGGELALCWSDGSEQFIPLRKLREECPCAWCKGEPDVAGPAHALPERPPFTPESFQLVSMEPIGGYGLRLTWGDGHSAGIYTYDTLRGL